MMVIDPKVKDYMEQLSSPQKETCEKARRILFSTFPDIQELGALVSR